MLLRPATPTTTKGAIEILRKGGIVAHATETCYGIACDLTNPEAVEQLFVIKKRPQDQPVSALFSSVEDTKRYVAWNADAEELATKYLPGPLTLILPLRPDAPHRLHTAPFQDRGQGTLLRFRATDGQAEDGGKMEHSSSVLSPKSHVLSPRTIGVRLSSHPLAQELARRFGRPLSTTSANVHGEPNPYDAQAIFERFAKEEHQPDLIIDSGVLPPNPPSTIIDLTHGGRTLRKGSVHI